MKHNLRLFGFRNITRLISISMLVLAVACNDDDDETLSVTGKKQAVYLSSERGSKSVAVASDAAWSAEIKNGDWAVINGSSTGMGDGKVLVDYKTNIGFPRNASLVISANGVADTIELRQHGITPVLEFVTPEGRSPGAGSDVMLAINNNFTSVHMHNTKIITVAKDETQIDWIQNVVISEDLKSLTFDVAPNASGVAREGILRLRFVDEWGVEHDADYIVTQPATGGTATTKEVTFEELKAKITAADGELEITEDIAVKGFVVSDAGNENIAQNPHSAPHTVDIQENYKTAYLQNAEATHGVCLKTVTKEDNILRRYSGLKLWVKGLTLVKESKPTRYTLKGVSANSFISITKGDAATFAKKEKKMSELTSDDINTFVTLKNCEFPIKEGSYSWLNEGYTYVYNANRMSCYPIVIRDAWGGSMYLMTNVRCPFRRDGKAVPKGAGPISGIIVNEQYTRFEQDGNIGKYQIRPLERDDIAVKSDLASSFSKIIVEWAKYEKDGASVKPTMGSGKIVHSANATIVGGSDYSYLGPITGVATEDNKGAVANGEFRAPTWWSGSKGNSWVISFQPSGISNATQLSLNMVTHSFQIGSPRYWTVEWSDHGIDGGAWAKIGDYTTPDAADWGNTLPTQIAGHKNLSMNLPVEMLKKRTVYVRLRVAQNKAGTKTSYDGATITTTLNNAIAYLSIIYN